MRACRDSSMANGVGTRNTPNGRLGRPAVRPVADFHVPDGLVGDARLYLTGTRPTTIPYASDASDDGFALAGTDLQARQPSTVNGESCGGNRARISPLSRSGPCKRPANLPEYESKPRKADRAPRRVPHKRSFYTSRSRLRCFGCSSFVISFSRLEFAPLGQGCLARHPGAPPGRPLGFRTRQIRGTPDSGR
jgi:hypothetical protein